MPAAEFAIDEGLVSRLLAEQHSDLAHLPLRVVEAWLGQCDVSPGWGDITSGDCSTDLASVWMLFGEPHAQRAALADYEVSEATFRRADGWAVLFSV